MTFESNKTDITPVQAVLTDTVSSCSETLYRNGRNVVADVSKSEELHGGNHNISLKMKNKLHIVISDQDGRTLFDSDRYLESLFIHVYDKDENLLFSSNEHSQTNNENYMNSLEFLKQATKMTRTSKNIKSCVNDSDNKKQCDFSPKSRRKTKTVSANQVIILELKE
uniref:Uncharacterized protein n=1 Tax=Arion vulgaris TaxID=1028688 RepID=A0A0B7BHK1_9EUPU